MKLIEKSRGGAICYVDNVYDAALCERLIREFESSSEKRSGLLSGGYEDPDVKNCTELKITGERWREINKLFEIPFKTAVDKYCKRHSGVNGLITRKSPFLMMKYEKGIGYFNWHSDAVYDDAKGSMKRLIAAVIYLNTVTEGGKTEFLEYETSIAPVQGRLALFPATWTHVHRSQQPQSGAKYILNSFLGC